jgi:PKD domain/Ig-like domain CHU_C associated
MYFYASNTHPMKKAAAIVMLYLLFVQGRTAPCDAPAAPVIDRGKTNVCAGIPDTLAAKLSKGVHYQWLHNGEKIKGATTGTLYTTDSGTFVLTATNECGTSSSAPFHITVHPNPQPPVYTKHRGLNYTFKTDVWPDAIYYWWDFGDNDTLMHQNVKHTFKKDSSYFVMVMIKDTFGCEGMGETILPSKGGKPDPLAMPRDMGSMHMH